MAASTQPRGAASGDSSASEIREGFLCPICMCDLGTLAQLSVHFDTAHSGEDRDALQSLKELFGSVKKKIKIKAGAEGGGGGGELSEAGSISEADSSLKDDLPVWEEQTLGHTRNHTSAFKAIRDERNSHAAIQRNKLVIRLKKLVDPSAPVDPQRRKEFEKSLVRWAPDEDVPLCPSCAATLGPPGGFGQTLKNLAKSNDVGDTPAVKLKELKDKFKLKQILGSRRHHCRTCGAVMCNDCSFFISFSMAERVVSVINEGNEVNETPTIEARKPLGKGVRRSGSNSSLNSMAAFEGEMYVRICRDCWTNLESRYHYLETLHAPHPTSHLYRVLMRSLQEIETECPIYVEMARALHRGEQTCELEDAQRKRSRLMKLCEGVDQVSKKILVNGKQAANAVEGQTSGAASEKQLKLQRVIRQMAANFLQDHVFGLQSLPSPEDYEQLKEKRQKELLREIEVQRQAELEAKRLAAKMEEVDESSSKRPTELSVGDKQSTKEGWLPTQVKADDAEDDPLLQQISIIKGYITQAKQAGKMDEVKMLTENLKDLQMVVRKEREERRRKEEERRSEEEKMKSKEEEEEREYGGRKAPVEEGERNDTNHQEEEYPDTLNPFAEDD